MRVDDEVGLLDVLARGWKTLAAFAVAGLLAAAAVLWAASPQWEASLTLQVGQVGGVAIEPPLRMSERIRRSAFVDGLLHELGWPEGRGSREGSLLRDSLRVVPIERAELLTVTWRVYDRNDSQRIGEAVTRRLADAYRSLSQATVERLQANLQEVQRVIGAVEQERAGLARTVVEQADSGKLGGRFAEAVIASNLMILSETELRHLRERRALLADRLSPMQMFPTRPLAQPDLGERPAWPRPTLTVALGLSIGLLFGIAWILVRASRRG